jgi:hypothetical protein
VDGGSVSTVTSLGPRGCEIEHGHDRVHSNAGGEDGEQEIRRRRSGDPERGRDGMTEEKQDAVIRESGRASQRRGAEEFYQEQQEQAADTKPGDAKRQP